ncbi:hypothetical protein BKA69DRAFT_1103986 [Paraphysoderma sedebokerense]|nr:hypothetical protein BKA69DRAFT_1103986 [Paraphysoderma sedebokerense]
MLIHITHIRLYCDFQFNGDPSSKRVHDLTNGRNAISKYSSNQSLDRTGRPQKTGSSGTSQTFPESAASEASKLSSKRKSVESRTLHGPRTKSVAREGIYEVAIRSGIPLETSDSVPLSDLKRKSTHSIDQPFRKRRRSRSQSDSSYQYSDSRIAHSRTFKPSNARRTSTSSASSSALHPVPSPKFVESKKLSRDRSDSKDHSKPLSIDRIGNKQSKSSSTFIPPAVVVKAVSVNTTRSGRKVTKPLEHWRNEKKAVDENGNVVVVSEQRDKVELYSGRRVRSSQHRRRSQDSTNAVNKESPSKARSIRRIIESEDEE